MVSNCPPLDSFLRSDGCRRFRPSSLASHVRKWPDHVSPELEAAIARGSQKRLAYGRTRRLRAAFWRGVARHQSEVLRWGRVSARGADVHAIRKLWKVEVKRIRRRWPNFEYLVVVGVTKSDILHLHFFWWGEYLPHDWLTQSWGELTDGDGVVWVDKVEDRRGALYYACRNLIGYVGSQVGQGRWDVSRGWGAPVVRARKRRGPGSWPASAHARGPAASGSGSTLGQNALDFVYGRYYSRRSVPRFSVAAGSYQSASCVGDILREVTRRYG
jgi:hypothetical protein